MPRTNLFSAYRQGENRVTGSLLAVLERLDLETVEQVLNAASGESALFQLVRFDLQPAGVGRSVPDARVGADFTLWFETKTARDTYSGRHAQEQLVEHLANLRADRDNDWLVSLTPDAEQPPFLTELADPRVRWISFAALAAALESVLADDARPSELVALLVRELVAMFEDEGLLTWDDTVIVAARVAYPMYLTHGVYVCQPGRSFKQGLTYLGFYAGGEVKPELSRIELNAGDLNLSEEGFARLVATHGDLGRELADRLRRLLDSEPRRHGDTNRVFLLSRPDEPATETLPRSVPNDLVGKSGDRTAYTMGQRYTSVKALRRVSSDRGQTSQL